MSRPVDPYRSGGVGGVTSASGNGIACDESYYMHASSDDYQPYSGSHKPPRGKRAKRFLPLVACE